MVNYHLAGEAQVRLESRRATASDEGSSWCCCSSDPPPAPPQWLPAPPGFLWGVSSEIQGSVSHLKCSYTDMWFTAFNIQLEGPSRSVFSITYRCSSTSSASFDSFLVPCGRKSSSKTVHLASRRLVTVYIYQTSYSTSYRNVPPFMDPGFTNLSLFCPAVDHVIRKGESYISGWECIWKWSHISS